MNCEEMREKNEMGEGGCMCVVGEKKKERQEVHRWWGKKKRNEEWGLRVWWGKRGSRKERRKNKIGFICMFTLFDAKCRIVKIYLEDVYNIFLL